MLLRNRFEAEDAVQQTYLAAYTSLLNGTEPRHPRAWLATIARNECRARIERRMREPLREVKPASTFADPVASAAARADLRALWQAIAELPRRQRTALLLRELSGLSYDELAHELDVSAPTVESLLFRARRELRARLQSATGSAAAFAPLAAVRAALARAVGGMNDPSAGALGGLVSATPLVAKVATGVAVVAATGATVASIGTHAAGKAAAPVRPVPETVPRKAERRAAAARAAGEPRAVVAAPTRPTPRAAANDAVRDAALVASAPPRRAPVTPRAVGPTVAAEPASEPAPVAAPVEAASIPAPPVPSTVPPPVTPINTVARPPESSGESEVRGEGGNGSGGDETGSNEDAGSTSSGAGSTSSGPGSDGSGSGSGSGSSGEGSSGEPSSGSGMAGGGSGSGSGSGADSGSSPSVERGGGGSDSSSSGRGSGSGGGGG